MDGLDIFYLSLSIGFIVLVGTVSYAAFQLVQTLRSIKILVEDIDDTAKDVRIAKEATKLNIFRIVSMVLGLFFKKGGEKNNG